MKTQLKDRTTPYRPLEQVDTPLTPSVRTDTAAKPEAPRRTTRWKAAVAALAIAAAAIGAVVVVNEGGNAETEPTVQPASPWPAGSGPGSNSLRVPAAGDVSPHLQAAATTSDAANPWPAGTGPSSNSLYIPPAGTRSPHLPPAAE